MRKRNEICVKYPNQCKDENYYKQEINNQLQKQYDLDLEIPLVFIDSDSQSQLHKKDGNEQQVFIKEASKLWEFALNQKELSFKGVGSLLRENEELRKEMSQINFGITDNITELSIKLDAEIEDRISRLINPI